MKEATDKELAASRSRHLLLRIFLHPTAQLSLSILFAAAGQLFLRLGASEARNDLWVGISGLASPWIGAGIAAQVTSLFSWLYALRSIKLLVAYNAVGLLHVIVPLASQTFLGEAISPSRWIGIALVLAGVLVVAAPSAKVEERL